MAGIGTPAISGSATISGNVTVIQPTASNLNATVVGTGTFAVQAAQSGTWNIGSVTTLPAITGVVTANAGTNLNTSLLALENGGNLAALTEVDYVEGAGTISKGVVVMGDNSTAPKAIAVDASGNVAVNIQNSVLPIGTVGSFTQFDLANSDPLAVGLVDANGDKIESLAVTNAGTFPVQTTSSITGIGHGVTTVTAAGTDEVLAGSTACKRVTIQAQTDNTGKIAVGASGVDATVATGDGVLLDAGDVFELDIDDLSKIYIDATVSGDGVRYCYFT